MNLHTAPPNMIMIALNLFSVVSICNFNFAYACYVASLNRRILSSLFSLCVHSEPSNTGRVHYVYMVSYSV